MWNTRLGGFLLLITFPRRNIIRLSRLVVKCTLRAIRTTACVLVVRLPTIPMILRRNLGLRVSAGLLNSRVCGLTYNVWVTVVCRRRLFDSRVG